MEGCPCLRRFIHLIRAFQWISTTLLQATTLQTYFHRNLSVPTTCELILKREIPDVTTIQLTNAHLVIVCDRDIEVTGYQSKVKTSKCCWDM